MERGGTENRAHRWRYFVLFLAVLAILLWMSWVPVFAQGADLDGLERVHSLDISIELEANGDAIFTEVWDLTVLQGTQWDLKLFNIKDSEVTALTVMDERGTPYKVLKKWDREKTLAQKKDRCGIVNANPAQQRVAWGIGEYGRRQYTVSYTVTNFVKDYGDRDGFDHTLVNDSSDLLIDKFSFKISAKNGGLTPENTQFWGMRYSGRMEMLNGVITGQSDSPLTVNDWPAMLVSFEKGLFTPASSGEGSMEHRVAYTFGEDEATGGRGGAVSTSTGADKIHDVNITVDIREDGDVKVTEVWDVTVLQAQNWNLSFKDMPIPLTNVRLEDEGGKSYHGSREKEEEVDLPSAGDFYLFSGSDGEKIQIGVREYGRQKFVLECKLENAVTTYKDYEGFSYRFIQAGQGYLVEHARVEVGFSGYASLSFSPDTNQFYAAGFEGQMALENGKLVAETTQPMTSKNSIVVGVSLPTGTVDSTKELREDYYFYGDFTLYMPHGCQQYEQGPVTMGAGVGQVHDFTSEIMVQKDGSLRVKEVWDITPGGGTEWYTTCPGNVEDTILLDVKVTDDTGREYSYTTKSWNENKYDWQMQASQQEKQGTFGVSYDVWNGNRISFGINGYERHQYTVEYTVPDATYALQGEDALRLEVLKERGSWVIPQSKVTFRVEGESLSAENSRIWAAGFNGKLDYQDGAVVAEILEPLDYLQFYNFGFAFSPGMFEPRNHKDSEQDAQTFFRFLQYEVEDTTSTNQGAGGFISAREKLPPMGGISAWMPSWMRDWVNGEIFFVIVGVGGMAVFQVLVGIFLYRRRTRRERCQRQYYKEQGFPVKNAYSNAFLKQVEYSRSVPFNGQVIPTVSVLGMIGAATSTTNLIQAYILRWILSGIVEVVPGEDGAKSAQIHFAKELESNLPVMEASEEKIYHFLKQAAGPDRILQKQDVKKWAKANGFSLYKWQAEYRTQQGLALASHGLKMAVPLSPWESVEVLNDSGLDAAKQIMGFKKYLRDFTIVQDRMPPEVKLWREYLVFASLFGMADQVAAAFAHLYPLEVQSVAGGQNLDRVISSGRYFSVAASNSMASSLDRYTRKVAAASSGGGGSSGGGRSSGGGSGSSGGGGSSSGGGRGGGRC